MNDKEREQWVLNSEALYRMQRTSSIGMRKFLRENRKEIDEYIKVVIRPPTKPRHIVWIDL